MRPVWKTSMSWCGDFRTNKWSTLTSRTHLLNVSRIATIKCMDWKYSPRFNANTLSPQEKVMTFDDVPRTLGRWLNCSQFSRIVLPLVHAVRWGFTRYHYPSPSNSSEYCWETTQTIATMKDSVCKYCLVFLMSVNVKDDQYQHWFLYTGAQAKVLMQYELQEERDAFIRELVASGHISEDKAKWY